MSWKFSQMYWKSSSSYGPSSSSSGSRAKYSALRETAEPIGLPVWMLAERRALVGVMFKSW
jgi:hypothetical protein